MSGIFQINSNLFQRQVAETELKKHNNVPSMKRWKHNDTILLLLAEHIYLIDYSEDGYIL